MGISLLTLLLERLDSKPQGPWFESLQWRSIYRLRMLSVVSTEHAPKLYLLSPYAVVGQQFSMTCSIPKADGLMELIQFRRRKAPAEPEGMLYQANETCIIYDWKPPPQIPPYDLYCAGGTNITSSEVKNYTLVMHPVSMADDGLWWCRRVFDYKTYEAVQVTVYSE